MTVAEKRDCFTMFAMTLSDTVIAKSGSNEAIYCIISSLILYFNMQKTLIHFLIFLLSATLLYILFFENQNNWRKFQIKYKREQLDKLYNIYKDNKSKLILKKIKNFEKFKIKKRYIYSSVFKREEYCVTCHIGIKDISISHPSAIFGCVSCHGGDPLSLNVKDAHKNLIGGKNPSSMEYVYQSCGQTINGTSCHKNEIKRVKTSLMYTMAGIISDLRYQWNASKDKTGHYATHNVEDDFGNKLKKIPFYNKNDIPENYKEKYEISGKIADSHFRKFCSMCHIGVSNINSTSNHSSGCATCHVIYENNSKYQGNDPTIPKNKPGYAPFHRLTKKIPSKQCIHCHNRSNRYGTSFIGIAENDFYGTPFVNGNLNKNRLIGGRFYYHLKSDIHFQKGMECIDCHTSNEVMGNGKIHFKMNEATLVKCEDCHGTYSKKIKTIEINSLRNKLLSKYRTLKLHDKIAVTKTNEYLPHIKKEGNNYFLYGKINKVKLKIKTVYQDRKHKINNCNKNMECYTCHYSWTMLCYGCHIGYNKKYKQKDFLTNYKSTGKWYEHRSYTRYNDTVLGINKRGKISPMQFCQSQVTFEDKNYDNKVFKHKDNTTSYVVAPVQPHTITKYSKKCSDCHNNPMAIGLGKGYLEFTDNEQIIFRPVYNVKKAGINVNFPFETIVSSDGRIQFQSVSDNGFQVFKRNRILKILRVGKCIPCHNSYNDKIYKNNNFTFFYNKVKNNKFKHIKEIESGK